MTYDRDQYQRELLDSVVRGVGQLTGQLAALCLAAGILFLLFATTTWLPMLILALGAFFLGAVFLATSVGISAFQLPEPSRSMPE